MFCSVAEWPSSSHRGQGLSWKSRTWTVIRRIVSKSNCTCPCVLWITITKCTVKNFGGKKIWRIRNVAIGIGSLAGKFWQIEFHLHRECYGNCENWRQNLAKFAIICQILAPKFFHRQCFSLYGNYGKSLNTTNCACTAYCVNQNASVDPFR